MASQKGFTLVELMVILVILAILITIAIPGLLGSKINANETSAFANLRTIVSSQLGFANRKEADLNTNGTGEYGTFGEMSGNIAVRAANGGTRYLAPTVINPSFRAISTLGEMMRSGYYYRIYLPGTGGAGLLELPGGGASEDVNAALAESNWCVYDWPQKFGTTGRKTFFVSQGGDITYTEDSLYSGPGAPIQAGAALREPGVLSNILGVPASGGTGRDGNIWRPAN
ncbi:MAG: type II secretion system protein [Planctomycetota bacterium]